VDRVEKGEDELDDFVEDDIFSEDEDTDLPSDCKDENARGDSGEDELFNWDIHNVIKTSMLNKWIHIQVSHLIALGTLVKHTSLLSDHGTVDVTLLSV
jgi:hypothetical protein